MTLKNAIYRFAAIMHWTKIFGNSSLTWKDIESVKAQTNLPIILKGIIHPEDAEKH